MGEKPGALLCGTYIKTCYKPGCKFLAGVKVHEGKNFQGAFIAGAPFSTIKEDGTFPDCEVESQEYLCYKSNPLLPLDAPRLKADCSNVCEEDGGNVETCEDYADRKVQICKYYAKIEKDHCEKAYPEKPTICEKVWEGVRRPTRRSRPYVRRCEKLV